MFPFRARHSSTVIPGRSGSVYVSQSRHTRADAFGCLSTHATYNRDTLATCTVVRRSWCCCWCSEVQWFQTEGLAHNDEPRCTAIAAAIRRNKSLKPRAAHERSGSAPLPSRMTRKNGDSTSRKDSLIPRWPLAGARAYCIADSRCITVAMYNLTRSFSFSPARSCFPLPLSFRSRFRITSTV